MTLNPTHLRSFSILTLWLLLNVFMALLNKSLFRNNAFPFPVFLSALHMIVAALLSHLCIKMHWIPTMALSPQENTHFNRVLYIFSILFVSNIALGNVSLDIVSIPFSQILRTTIPYTTMLLSALLLGATFSPRVVLSVLPVSLGVALTVYGNVEFSWMALLIIELGIIAASLKVTLTSMYLSKYKAMHPVEFLARICPISAVYLIAFATFQGETGALLQQWRSGGLQMSTILCALFTGICAFALNWSNFEATRGTSPLTMCVAGNVKQVLTVLLSIYFFGTRLKWWNGIGIALALAGTVIYSVLKMQEQSSGGKEVQAKGSAKKEH